MKSVNLKTIKELLEKIKVENLDPKRLRIILDNDCTTFYYGDEEKDDDFMDIAIEETNGYRDIEPLYKLLFPESNVHWC